jgi:hypothetical protein
MISLRAELRFSMLIDGKKFLFTLPLGDYEPCLGDLQGSKGKFEEDSSYCDY